MRGNTSKNKDLIEEIIKHNLLFVASSMNQNRWVLLKNDIRGPLFFDTSKIIAYPGLMQMITQCAINVIKGDEIKFDLILGAPYGGLPLSYFLAAALKTPCLTMRKEGIKKDGTMPTSAEILGVFKKGDKVLIIEDAVLSANTVIEFAQRLRKVGLEITDVLTMVDVGRSGAENLKAQNIRLHSLFTWKDLFDCYKELRSDRLSLEVKTYLEEMFKESRK
ncbi:MAG: phosphoribosyltransferase family protein [Candidatus Paceibacterota bacterium]|jgi:uridine monophosphate synthetase